MKAIVGKALTQAVIIIALTIVAILLVFSPFILDYFSSWSDEKKSVKWRWAKFSALINASVAVILMITMFVSVLNFNAIRNEFLSNHPPQFLIKEIHVKVEPNQVPQGRLILVNAGLSDASFVPTNKGERGTVLVRLSDEPLPAKSPLWEYHNSKDWPNKLGVKTFGSGAAIEWEFKGEEELSDQDIRDIEAGNRALYALGLLKYSDERDVGRRTLFCRRYDPNSKTFKHTNNSDCEYGT